MASYANHIRTFISAFAVLSVLLLGPGHGSRAQPLDPEMVAYLQAGGTLADLCINSGDDPSGMGKDCPDCNLCKTIVLDTFARMAILISVRSEKIAPLLERSPRDGNDTRGPPVRGPPFSHV